ncbi:hypothetical protein QQF64_008172 [Cirrhinus molitorella]|uniref:Uncharacterized protein n=1 Tax=Cirrhinus molitorella TaxID=172907 RepID=A0ABR3M5F3_9TELE
MQTSSNLSNEREKSKASETERSSSVLTVRLPPGSGTVGYGRAASVRTPDPSRIVPETPVPGVTDDRGEEEEEDDGVPAADYFKSRTPSRASGADKHLAHTQSASSAADGYWKTSSRGKDAIISSDAGREDDGEMCCVTDSLITNNSRISEEPIHAGNAITTKCFTERPSDPIIVLRWTEHRHTLTGVSLSCPAPPEIHRDEISI